MVQPLVTFGTLFRPIVITIVSPDRRLTNHEIRSWSRSPQKVSQMCPSMCPRMCPRKCPRDTFVVHGWNFYSSRSEAIQTLSLSQHRKYKCLRNARLVSHIIHLPEERGMGTDSCHVTKKCPESYSAKSLRGADPVAAPGPCPAPSKPARSLFLVRRRRFGAWQTSCKPARLAESSSL